MRCASVVALMFLGACAATAGLNKLNVVALDAQGQPVTGLGKVDFQVLEDGKPLDTPFFVSRERRHCAPLWS